MLWRLKSDRRRVASFFIINLGVSDWLMGCYMLIIGSVDASYRGSYIVHADAWRSSVLCQFAGILAMLSSEVSGGWSQPDLSEGNMHHGQADLLANLKTKPS